MLPYAENEKYLIFWPQENTFRESKLKEQLGHAFPHIPISHPRKGTCSNVWQVGAVMNILLKRKMLNFNSNDGGSSPKILDRFLGYSLGLGNGINHSIGLDERECANLYSRRLRELVKRCLMREPFDRPSSTTLVQHTTEGLAYSYHTIQGLQSNIPPQIASRDIPILTLSNPEPPMEWIIDTSEFELDMRDNELLTRNVPAASTGGSTGILGPLRGVGLPLINSILSSVAPSSSSGSTVAATSRGLSMPSGDGSLSKDALDMDFVYLQ